MQSGTDLKNVSQMLKYIIKLQNDKEMDNKYKHAVLSNYLIEIKKSINEITDKIIDMHNIISNCEESSSKNNSYKTLYDNTFADKKNEGDFLKMFGPYMLAWNLCQ